VAGDEQGVEGVDCGTRLEENQTGQQLTEEVNAAKAGNYREKTLEGLKPIRSERGARWKENEISYSNRFWKRKRDSIVRGALRVEPALQKASHPNRRRYEGKKNHSREAFSYKKKKGTTLLRKKISNTSGRPLGNTKASGERNPMGKDEKKNAI